MTCQQVVRDRRRKIRNCDGASATIFFGTATDLLVADWLVAGY